MTYRKTTVQFASISEALAHFYRQGYETVDTGTDTAIMTKHVDGCKVGEVIINREAFLTVVAEKLELESV
jgi:hypothetical protein